MSLDFNMNAPAPASRDRWGGPPRRWSDADIRGAVELLRTRGFAAFAVDPNSKQRGASDAKSLARAVLRSDHWPAINGAQWPAFISGKPEEIDGRWHAYLVVKTTVFRHGVECDQDGNPLRKTYKKTNGRVA